MPTIIDELTMTLSLDPGGFKEGATEANAASDSLLAQVMATLAKIEQATKQTAANTARVQKDAATIAKEEADKAEAAQTAAARKAAREQEAAAKKTADDMRKHGRDMEEAFGKVGNSIKRVGLELLAMMGISMSVSAVERLFSGLNKANLEAGYFSRNIGMNAEALTQWENMAARVGGTAEGIRSAFAKVTFEEQQFHTTGVSNLPTQVRELFGANIASGPGGAWLKGNDLAIALAEGAERKGLSPEQTAFRLQRMGLEGLVNPVNAGSVELRRQQEVQKRSGNFVTEEDTKQAKQLTNDLDQMYQSAMGLARVFWRELGPAIDQVVQRIVRWIDKNRDWLTKEAEEWGKRLAKAILQLADDFGKLMNSEGFKNFATTVGEIAGSANQAAQAMGGWTTVLSTMAELWIGGKVAGMIASMFRFSGALGAIGVAGGVANAALEVLSLTWLGNKMGQDDTRERAKALGWEDKNKGSWWKDETFTKNGEEIDWGEMQRRLGYGPNGQTMGQSFGFGRPPMPGGATPGTTPGGTGGAPTAPAYHSTAPGAAPVPAADLSMGADALTRGVNVRDNLARDLDIPPDAAAGIVGNLQAESNLRAVQEGRPISGRGGFGWAQWTGPRRVEFENYAKQHGLDPSSDAANYGFLLKELHADPRLLAQLKGLKGTPAEIAQQSAQIIQDHYERPAAATAHTERRKSNAVQVALAPSQGATLPPRPSLVPSPAATATLGAPEFAPDGTRLGGSNAARRDDFATKVPEPVGANVAAQGFQMSSNSTVDRSQSNATHIAELHVHSAATDAAGIAKDIHGELRRFNYVTQSDVGLA